MKAKNFISDIALDLLRSIEDLSLVHQRMIGNLLEEEGLEDSHWQVLDEMLAEASDVEEAVRSFARCTCLAGKLAKVPPDCTLGRAVSLEQFCSMLVKLGYHNDVEEAKCAVRIQMGRPISEVIEAWPRRPLGRFLMWSTFDVCGGDPFGPETPSAAVILCMLGLPPVEGPVLLFRYKLPVGIKSRIPTFCDAYAGDFWPGYFKFAETLKGYGLTSPTENCPRKEGCPEVVHEVIDMEQIVSPLEFAL